MIYLLLVNITEERDLGIIQQYAKISEIGILIMIPLYILQILVILFLMLLMYYFIEEEQINYYQI